MGTILIDFNFQGDEAMPRVLILSDSHGWDHEVQAIKERNQHNADAMIHCGDSELTFDSEALKGFAKVRGNMDMDAQFPNEQEIKVGNMHFFITHGHLFNIHSSLMNLSYRADELGANIICYGHSHIAIAEKQNDQLIINPGSIRQPRSAHPGSYAILESDNELKEVSVRFYTKDDQEITSLAYQTSLH